MSKLSRTIRNDPELNAKEQELRDLGIQMGEVEIAVKRGEMPEANGAARLDELEGLGAEARQGPVYERWKQAYRDAATEAAARREGE
jgi:hypothetical protein